MNKRRITVWLVWVVVLSLLVACGEDLGPVSSSEAQVTSIAEASVGGSALLQSGIVQIVLNGDSIAVDGPGAAVDGSRVTITAAGTYSLSGALTDGQVIVNTGDEAPVSLILNGADIRSSTSAPTYVMSAAAVGIVLADGSQNLVSDGVSYILESAETDEPNAAIFSKSELSISGNGTLTVYGNYNDGIASKDGLTIESGTVSVNAVDDGIRGKDLLAIRGGTVTVTAQGDGLKADNEADTTLGIVSIENGVISVTAGGDAIEAENTVMISGGTLELTAGGGAYARIDAAASAKGIKGTASVTIDGGAITIDSADDAIHSNDSVTINGGTFLLATGNDAVHADATLTINGGDINVTTSFEGLESAVITINNGTIHIVASDDALNVAGGTDGSGMAMGPGRGGGRGQPGTPGQDAFAANSNYHLYINGGYIAIDSGGDGVDVNGSIDMTGGVVLVNGPTEQMNGALDCDGPFTVTGGFLVAVGSAGMAEAPDNSSTQVAVLVNLNATVPAGTLVRLQASDGTELVTFAPTKDYQSIAFSSPQLAAGSTVDVYLGGSATGAASDGLYQGGTYAAGTRYTSLTLSGMVTVLGGRTR